MTTANSDCCYFKQLLQPTTQQFDICDNANDPSFVERGLFALAQGSPSAIVPFGTEKVSDKYTFIELAVKNLVDSNPLGITVEVISQGKKNFKVSLSGLPDSGNYQLVWSMYVTSL